MSLRRLPALLSFLMLGALSLRVGFPFVLAVPSVVIIICSLFVTGEFLQKAQSIMLALGSLAWPAMALIRINERLALVQPFMRLAFIFGAVTIFTFWSAWLLWPKKKETDQKIAVL